MELTFKTFNQFMELSRANNALIVPYNAGIGDHGKNISAVMRINNKVYARLSPIASTCYADTTTDIGNGRVAKEIEHILTHFGQ